MSETPNTLKPSCGCPYEWRSHGFLYGISLGKGWVRMDTNPACPKHGVPAGVAMNCPNCGVRLIRVDNPYRVEIRHPRGQECGAWRCLCGNWTTSETCDHTDSGSRSDVVT